MSAKPITAPTSKKPDSAVVLMVAVSLSPGIDTKHRIEDDPALLKAVRVL